MIDFSHVSVMVSLPRSRSQWMTYFMGFGCVAWHDPLKDCRSPKDLVQRIRTWSEQNPGRRLFIADTYAAAVLRQLVEAMPGAYFFGVLRDPATVSTSARKLGGMFDVRVGVKMHEAIHLSGVDRYPMAALHDEAVLRDLYQRVTDKPYLGAVTAARLTRIDAAGAIGNAPNFHLLQRYSEL